MVEVENFINNFVISFLFIIKDTYSLCRSENIITCTIFQIAFQMQTKCGDKNPSSIGIPIPFEQIPH